ncbi:MAG: ABC transporter ATP-binding protein [Nitrososphaerota archaeon]|nr:ABC transporter ATP-binding protein [Nitrososphaerota archaeon]MDG6916469.1 ABC transporter ATP-binding protein [Nitrososphaerota archaeon]MDG6918816.1 ABC transporter ATP-binding protein [Nitrososphaerota archaeon]MDG6946568.1 ABC transporter ATP-binding protein [Nitrososphaerota archaeon]MDG6947725.1 ABC transporter ATP-binding protein [Nitrososphaerota archaeon]
MPPSIEAQQLTKRYGQFTALSGLDLNIHGTKCVGFLGPNGAGKTTTMKILTGLIRASKGTALINGVDVASDKKTALASCATLIETPEIYPSLTPKEALSMLCEIRGVPRQDRNKRIDDALARVKMSEWADKKVGGFSKGMKQRVNVASTLLSDPEVIILDEPSSGLDPRGMSEVRDIVMSLRDRLVFMSSHLLAEVTEVCQEVALIDHGKLLVYDTIENVTAKFSGGGGAVEVGFAGNVDEQLRARVSKLPGVTSTTKSNDRHLLLKYDTAVLTQDKLLESVAGLKAGAITFSQASGLEDAYLSLIKETL